MTEPRSLLLVGKVRPERKRSLTGMAVAADLSLVAIEDSAEALTWMDANDPGCILVDAGASRLDKLIAKLRTKRQLGHVPVMALVSAPDDLWIEQYFGWGGDDVVHVDAGSTLLERLRAVPREAPKTHPNHRALIGDPDKSRTDVIARVFGLAGFDVKSAIDRKSLEFYVQQYDPPVVIANAILGDLPELIARTRKDGAQAVWVILAARRELEAQQSALAKVERCVVMGVQVNPWQLLYRANELGRSDTTDLRRERRRPFGSFVLFRAAGSDDDDVGVAYNLSSRGMFIRTFAPVLSEDVWLEWRVPQDKTRVRLEGKVVWRQASLAQADRSASPLGFGVEFCDYLGGSRKHLERALEVLDSGGRRSIPPPAPMGGSPTGSDAPAAISAPPEPSGAAESDSQRLTPVPSSAEAEAVKASLKSTAQSLSKTGLAPLSKAMSPGATRTASTAGTSASKSASVTGTASAAAATSKASPSMRPAAKTAVASKAPSQPVSQATTRRAAPPLGAPSAANKPATPPNQAPPRVGPPRTAGPPRPAGTAPSAAAAGTTGVSSGSSAPSGSTASAESSSAAAAPTSAAPSPGQPTVGETPISAPRGFGTSGEAGRASTVGADTLVGPMTTKGLGPAAGTPSEPNEQQTAPASRAADVADPAVEDGTASGHDLIEEGPNSSETTEILDNPTALFEAVQEPKHPLYSSADDVPTVVTNPLLALEQARASTGADELPPSSRAAESFFASEEQVTQQWHSESAKAQGLEDRSLDNESTDFRPPRRRGSAVIVVVFVVLAGALAAVGLWLRSSGRGLLGSDPTPKVPLSARPSATLPPAATTPAGVAEVVDAGQTRTAAADSGVGADAGGPGWAPTDDGQPREGWPAVEELQTGSARLLADRYGYLIVRFPEAAFIFSDNIAMGATNWKIATTCGEKTLRVGVGEKPVLWLSDEWKVNVACRETTRVVFPRLTGVVVPPGVTRPIAPGSMPARKARKGAETEREGSEPGSGAEPQATAEKPKPNRAESAGTDDSQPKAEPAVPDTRE